MTNVREPEIVIVGAGVSGLTSAIELLAEGVKVKIITHQLAPQAASGVAGAFWEPYKVEPWERVRGWSQSSLEKFRSLAKQPATGVSITKLIQIFAEPTHAPEWMDMVGSRAAVEAELPPGFPCGYVMEVPKIETPLYLPYLLKRFVDNGGVLEQVDEPLTVGQLHASNRIIVNCTGVGAKDFCNDDEVFPMRGQIVSIEPQSNIDAILLHESSDTTHTLIFPRTNDCVLGGTAQRDNWNLVDDPGTAEEIMANCAKLLPEIKGSKILANKVGLRPGRREVRLELEEVDATCAIVHNYGHGGSGFTLSWGCAQEVCDLISAWTKGKKEYVVGSTAPPR
jgi:D-amino-acid oxidase